MHTHYYQRKDLQLLHRDHGKVLNLSEGSSCTLLLLCLPRQLCVTSGQTQIAMQSMLGEGALTKKNLYLK